MEAWVEQNIALRELLQYLIAWDIAPKFDAFGHAEFLRELLQAFLLGTISDQPIFALGKSRAKFSKSSQPQVKALEVHESTDTQHSKWYALPNVHRVESFYFDLIHAYCWQNRNLAATKRAKPGFGLGSGGQPDSCSPRGHSNKRIDLPQEPRERAKTLENLSAQAEGP